MNDFCLIYVADEALVSVVVNKTGGGKYFKTEVPFPYRDSYEAEVSESRSGINYTA